MAAGGRARRGLPHHQRLPLRHLQGPPGVVLQRAHRDAVHRAAAPPARLLRVPPRHGSGPGGDHPGDGAQSGQRALPGQPGAGVALRGPRPRRPRQAGGQLLRAHFGGGYHPLQVPQRPVPLPLHPGERRREHHDEAARRQGGPRCGAPRAHAVLRRGGADRGRGKAALRHGLQAEHRAGAAEPAADAERDALGRDLGQGDHQVRGHVPHAGLPRPQLAARGRGPHDAGPRGLGPAGERGGGGQRAAHGRHGDPGAGHAAGGHRELADRRGGGVPRNHLHGGDRQRAGAAGWGPRRRRRGGGGLARGAVLRGARGLHRGDLHLRGAHLQPQRPLRRPAPAPRQHLPGGDAAARGAALLLPLPGGHGGDGAHLP
mmetsp:Transcript_50604/g.161935  ORF Transcript_50604/g.161935 Transcript_50604/m.161935 type:complete len:373 (+) Transcript_50604:3445-4563(+)